MHFFLKHTEVTQYVNGTSGIHEKRLDCKFMAQMNLTLIEIFVIYRVQRQEESNHC